LTYCVSANGVDSLLPVAQKVVFVKGESIPAVFADWSRVRDTFAELMEPTEDYPRRYRVREGMAREWREWGLEGMGSDV